MNEWETEVIIFPLACPGCREDFDSRRHTEAWCAECRPADGAYRPAFGDLDGQARAPDLASLSSQVDPQNQRAASELWGRGRKP